MVLFFVVIASAAVSAQVFKRIGPDGSIQFSDRPGPDAEEVEVAPTQTVQPTPVQGLDNPQHQEGQPLEYSEFAITSPANEEGVRANDGNVTVRLALRPALRRGHTIAVSIDGERIGAGTSTSIQMTNLTRGGHTLQALVLDADGEELAQTDAVTFYVLRAAGGS